MRPSFRWLAAYAMTLALLGVFVPLSGLASVTLSTRVAWTLMLLSCAGAALFDRWLVSALRGVPKGPVLAGPRRSMTVVFWAVAVACLGAYGLLWIVAYFRPDFTWDGMTYHLPTVQFWAERGFVHWIDLPGGSLWEKNGNALLNGYPKGAEVVAFFLSVVSNGKLVNAPNLVYLPLAILGIVYVARELGAGRAAAAASGALFVVVPTNVGQAASTYVDTAYASAVVAFLATLFAVLRAAVRAERTTLLPLALVSGIPLGLALGVKAPALALGPLGAVFVVVAGMSGRGKEGMRAPLLRSIAVAMVAMGLVGGTTGGFWYARNLVERGNPLFPVEVRVAGRVIVPGVPVGEQIAEEANTPAFMATWSTTRRVFYTWRQSGRIEWPIDARIEHNDLGYAIDVPEAGEPGWPRSIRYQDPRSGGLGVLWLGGGVPAIVACAGLFLWRIRRAESVADRRLARREALSFFLYGALILVFFLMTPMRWWARYTLWLFALGLPAWAVTAQAIASDAPGGARRLLQVGGRIALALVFCGVAFEFGYAVKWDHTPPYFVGPPCAYSSCTPRAFWHALTSSRSEGTEAIYMDLGSNELARSALASASTVAVGALSVGNGPVLGQLSMPPGARHVIPMDFDAGRDRAAAAAFVSRHLPRYIVWDHETGGDAPVLIATATRWTWFRSLMIFEFGHHPEPPPPLTPK